ncbi:hypothetical protein IQ264_08280 [Phormidium sp. LEGE 05292]|uniref:hypothetical protein n=1 Tax=[Phormidium] sp. LEGE 05292 TaxID=767427 RepID=UPI0018829A4D|nr:hypothetical protein [Phormidium sp. LEGE 05292]MBE9225427.1 hypothetical protein [Phormidium sp. LEGE 05292]
MNRLLFGLFAAGMSGFFLLSSIARIAGIDTRIGTVSLIIQGAIIALLVIALASTIAFPTIVESVTKSDIKGLLVLIALLAIAGLIGVILAWV